MPSWKSDSRPSQNPSQNSGSYDRAVLGDGRSPAVQALYATDAVKEGLECLSSLERAYLIPDDDDDYYYDDDDDPEIHPVEFARRYLSHDPVTAKWIRDHDNKMRERLVEGVLSWVKGVQSASETV